MNIESQFQQEKDEKTKLLEKLQNNEKKLKKMNEIINENKRKHKIIADKTKECQQLREELDVVKVKAKERDQVHQKNKELVTKQYQQQSAMEYKDKKIQELQNQNNELAE